MNFQMVVILWHQTAVGTLPYFCQGNYFDGLLSAEAAVWWQPVLCWPSLLILICHFQKDAVLIIISCLITPAGIKNMRGSVRPSIK